MGRNGKYTRGQTSHTKDSMETLKQRHQQLLWATLNTVPSFDDSNNRKPTSHGSGSIATSNIGHCLIGKGAPGLIVAWSGKRYNPKHRWAAWHYCQKLSQVVLTPAPQGLSGLIDQRWKLLADDLWPDIKLHIMQWKRRYPHQPLYFCGHGYGGALAQLFAMLAAQDGIATAEVVSFGAPLIGNRDFAQQHLQRPLIVYNYEQALDPVPHLANLSAFPGPTIKTPLVPIGQTHIIKGNCSGPVSNLDITKKLHILNRYLNFEGKQLNELLEAHSCDHQHGYAGEWLKEAWLNGAWSELKANWLPNPQSHKVQPQPLHEKAGTVEHPTHHNT